MYGKGIMFNSFFSNSSPSLLCIHSLDGNHRDLFRKQNWSNHTSIENFAMSSCCYQNKYKVYFYDYQGPCGLAFTSCTHTHSLYCFVLLTLAFSCSLLFAGSPWLPTKAFVSGVCSARSTSFLFQTCHSFNLTLVCVIIICGLCLSLCWNSACQLCWQLDHQAYSSADTRLGLSKWTQE